MNQLRIGCLLLLAAVWWSGAQAALVEQEVEYRAGDTTLRGFLVYDDATEGLRPGVLVVHEWWGHNEYARRRARMLAEQGYNALAVDMYGEGKQADHPKDAGAFASEVMSNLQLGVDRFRAARAFLDAQPQTDPSRVAAIGYCFGGAVVLHMARIGEDLRLVASFHGSLGAQTPAEPNGVKGRVLVYHGGADAMITPEAVSDFEREMKRAGVDYAVTVYPGAKHSFTVPDADAKAAAFNLPLGYDANADQASWRDLLSELRHAFAPVLPDNHP